MLIELDIERMSFGPAAVGRYQVTGDEKPVVVFVPGAAPGERVKANVSRKHKNFWEAELVEIVSPSKSRVAPPCPVYDSCGGCQWQHLEYSAQIEAKKEILIHQLQRSTRLAKEDLEAKLHVHAAPQLFGYRSRLQAHGDANGIGFFAQGTHQIVPVDRCLVAHPDIQKAWTDFSNQRDLKGLAQNTGQFKVEWTRDASGSVREAINRKHGVFGFTQINSEQNEKLVEIVTNLARSESKKKLALDLFGGRGNLSRNLASSYDHVICVDTFNDGAHPTQVTPPLKPEVTLVQSKVEDFIADQRWRDWGFEEIDCVIADPPRNGLREAARLVANLKAPRLVLVSCDPSTLARDLSELVGASSASQKDPAYRVDSIHLVDMFPQTFHMEIVIGCSSTVTT